MRVCEEGEGRGCVKAAAAGGQTGWAVTDAIRDRHARRRQAAPSEYIGLSEKRAQEFDVASLRQVRSHAAAARGVSHEKRVDLGAWEGGVLADKRYIPVLPSTRRHFLLPSKLPEWYSKQVLLRQVMTCFCLLSPSG